MNKKNESVRNFVKLRNIRLLDAIVVHLWATVLYVRKSKDGETARLPAKY